MSHFYNFAVLLTVHLSIFISVINQLDAQNFCFTISLFHASTCFQHMCSKHVEAWNKLIVKQKFCTSSWLITEINIFLSCRAKCQDVSRWPFPKEARYRTHISPRETSSGQGGKGFLGVFLFSPVSISPPMLHTHLHLNVVLHRRKNGRRL